MMGWGDGALGKVPALKTQGPEFEAQKPLSKNLSTAV